MLPGQRALSVVDEVVQSSSWNRLIVLSTVAAFLIGCGGEGPYSGQLYPTRGKVMLSDGQPLTGGSIQLIPSLGGLPAFGKIGLDGTYSLTSLNGRDGAAPGEYKVRFEPDPEFLKKQKGKAQKLPFASKYRDLDGETGLNTTIKAAPSELEPFVLQVK